MAKGKGTDELKDHPLADRIYLLCNFLDNFRKSIRLATPRRYCFILGAGASLPSGIPSAQDLTKRWLEEHYLSKHPSLKETDVKEDDVRKWATPKILGIPDFDYDRRAEFYGDIYALLFNEDRPLGQESLRTVMVGKKPSIGYSVLAQILAKTPHRIVITTNFDHLTEEALQRYTETEPHVVENETAARYLGKEHHRPIIAKIHGDIFRETYNAKEDIEKLKEQWKKPLRKIFKEYYPIFIGYGGNDPGFMEFLTNETDEEWLQHGFVWAYRPKSGLPKNQRIINLIKKHKGRLLPIPGFDEFFLLLGDVFGFEKLDKQMELAHAQRVENYRESFNEAVASLSDEAKFQDADHYLELVQVVIGRLVNEGKERGWWDWVVEANKEKRPDDALKIFEKAIKALPDAPQLLTAFTLFLAENKPQYPDAENIGISAVEITKRLYGAEHADTLVSQNNLAELYWYKGMYDKAAPLYLETLATREHILGSEHSATLTSRNNLAGLYQAKGDYNKALPLYEETLAIRERVLGTEHPDTLTSRNNLAGLYQAKGDYVKALALIEETLAIREQVPGAEHPDTLTSRNNLANLYQAKGDYAKALPLYESTLAVRERVLGVEHPDTLTSRNNLANLYQDQGDYAKALPLFQDTLAISERVLGIEHPDTLTSRNNLANLYQDQGDYAKALPIFQNTLAVHERVLGVEHPDTLTSRNNLALLYEYLGDYAKAQPLFEDTLTICGRVFGIEHPNTLTSRNNLALLYQDQGNYAKALPLFEEVLTVSKRVLGNEHPLSLTYRNNLAEIYQDQADFVKALPLLEETLAVRERVLGVEHPDTLVSRNNLALIYQDQRDYTKALPLLERTLAVSERVLGAEHPNTLVSRNNLARCRAEADAQINASKKKQ